MSRVGGVLSYIASSDNCFCSCPFCWLWGMAPAKKPIHELGDVSRNGGGWRAGMNIPDRVVAPTRASKEEADMDLVAMRAPVSRDGVRRAVEGFRAHVAVRVHSASASDVAVGAGGRPNGATSGASVRDVSDGAAAVEWCSVALEANVGMAASPEQAATVSALPGLNVQRPFASGDAARSSAVTLALRGLNVQWPFSQLLLAGLKDCEIRRYALGHRNIARAGAELWIVETSGPCGSASRNAMPGDVSLGARPAKAQIVGTVVFSSSAPYAELSEFRADEAAHRIKVGGAFDWDGHGEMHAWRVASVRPLARPVPVASTGQTGFGPRSFNVTFLRGGAALCAGAPPLAIVTPVGGATSDTGGKRRRLSGGAGER